MTTLIDPPSNFAPTSEWEDFIKELEGLEQDPDVVRAIKRAKEKMAFIREQQGI